MNTLTANLPGLPGPAAASAPAAPETHDSTTRHRRAGRIERDGRPDDVVAAVRSKVATPLTRPALAAV
jgi:hypothetical protein